MSYPGYQPQYQRVVKTGGYNRTCLVIELLSTDALDPVQLTHLREQLEALLAKSRVVEKSQVVTPDRFDRLLLDGLRL